jgi:hypothetical protein
VFYSRTPSLPDVMRNILNVVIASLVVLIMMNYAWPLFEQSLCYFATEIYHRNRANGAWAK